MTKPVNRCVVGMCRRPGNEYCGTCKRYYCDLHWYGWHNHESSCNLDSRCKYCGSPDGSEHCVDCDAFICFSCQDDNFVSHDDTDEIEFVCGECQEKRALRDAVILHDASSE